MKKFSKILALVLSLIMVMSCFVACSDKKAADDAKTTVKTSKTDTDKKIEKGSDEFSPKQTVIDCFETMKSGDLKAMRAYCADDETYELLTQNADVNAMSELFEGAMEYGISEDEIREMTEELLQKVFANFTYEVGEPQIDGDKAVVPVELAAPDFDSLDMESIDMVSLMLEAVGAMGYSEEELNEMTEDEAMEIMPDLMRATFELLGDELAKQLEEMDVPAESGSLNLVKVDGKWLITAQ